MMDERLTRCPHCKTCFLITEAILQQGLGVARCGNCLKIYNASHHMFELEQGAHLPPVQDDAPVSEDPISLSEVPSAHHTDRPSKPQNAIPDPAFNSFEQDQLSPLPELSSFELDEDDLGSIRQARKQSSQSASETDFDEALQTLIADPEFYQGHVTENRRFPKESDRIPLTEQLSIWLKHKLILPFALFFAASLVIFIILWANSRLLAQYPALSGLAEGICSLTRCDHLLISDFEQLQAKQMSVVASEGEHLYTEFVLENNGEQIRFPAIAITLKNALGEAIDEQIFQPDQYLKNKPFADHQLPSGLPISLSFPFPPTEQDVKQFSVLFLPPLN